MCIRLILKYRVVTFLCHHTQHDFLKTFLFVICNMGVIYIDRNTTAGRYKVYI